jgi:hypothetical protein
MEIKKGIPIKDRANIIDWAYPFFEHLIDRELFGAIIMHETEWSISSILIDDNEKILGVYLLGESSPAYLMDKDIWFDKYSRLEGVEGVMLAIDPTIRKQGWGSKLKDYPKTLGADYIWGQQLKGLNNLNEWLKRRELVGETDDCYITAEIFSK